MGTSPNKSEKIRDDLRAKGSRMTRARGALIEAIAHSPGPRTAAELGDELRAREIPVNKTTIYREIDFLVAEGVIREIDLLDGRKRYELHDPEGHHHHLVCNECGAIQCVELPRDLETLERKIESAHAFKITSHVLEFFGVCAECHRAPKAPSSSKSVRGTQKPTKRARARLPKGNARRR